MAGACGGVGTAGRGGRGRHPRVPSKKGTRGNHFDVSTGDFRVPVETVQTKWEKSDVETRVYRHPWKPTYPRRAPVETGHPWKPRVGAPVETGKWFPRVPDFAKGAPVETEFTIPAKKSDVETSPLVSTGARRRFSFPRVPNRAPVETNTPGQTWKRAPVETVSPGQTWKPLGIGHPWKPFSSLYHKGMSSTYMIVPRDNTNPLAYWPPRRPVHNATIPKWFPRVPVLV